jgi:hypothetical protein
MEMDELNSPADTANANEVDEDQGNGQHHLELPEAVRSVELLIVR